MTLTLEKRAVLTNTLLKVKDVPVFYLPAMYYPINKEDRATGFLIPIYGTSTIKGQTLKQRLLLGDQPQPGRDAVPQTTTRRPARASAASIATSSRRRSSGNVQTYVLREHDATYEQSDGTTKTSAGHRQLPGQRQHDAGAGRASAADAATPTISPASIAQQRYQQNIYAATNRTRSFGINVVGQLGRQHASAARSTATRSSPTTPQLERRSDRCRASHYSRGEKKIGDLPVYFGASSEYVTLIRTDQLRRHRTPIAA